MYNLFKNKMPKELLYVMKKLFLFIPIICFLGCNPEEENTDEATEYYDCVKTGKPWHVNRDQTFV